MGDDSKKNQTNPLAEAKNWDDRLRTEAEAPHKWAETWGTLFDNGVPHDYEARKQYYLKKLEEMPATKQLPRYGVGEAFKEIGGKDYRHKRFPPPSDETS